MKQLLYDKYVLLPLKDNKAPNINKWDNLSPTTKCKYDLIEKSEYIGFICGFNGVEVIDIDNHFGDADALFEFIYNNYDLTEYPIVKTKGGGYHIYFSSDNPRGNLKFARRINDKNRPETLVESRGVGGYVVCPPSTGYTILQGDLFNIPKITEQQRGALISVCQALDEIPHEKEENTHTLGNGKRPGDEYNNNTANIEVTKTILRNFGWTSDEKEKHWTRPGKEKKDGISATFGKVGDNKFYVFSSNAYPFESGCSYSMFSVKALLEYNGDFSACAKAIAPAKEKATKEKKISEEAKESAKDYIRIGDMYYKNIVHFDKWGNSHNRISKRVRQTLVDDFGKEFLKEVKKYDDFVNIPLHKNFQKNIGECYNMYQEIQFESKKGTFPTIEKFIGHIFGTGEKNGFKETEMGYDYIQILYKEPLQILPVLCLVSEENETGKTTFGNFLNCIFGGNFAAIGQQELKTEFNGSYASKLIAMIDEGWIDYRIIDKLKQLSTSDKIQLRQMHRDHSTIDFFCKWILCSNRTKDFIVANEKDERYWVRRLTKFGKFDPNFLNKLKEEIPAFLYFLENRELHTPRESRMHFSVELIKTDALQDVIRATKDIATKDFVELLLETMEEKQLQEIDCSIKDLKERFFDRRNDLPFSKIKEILQEQLKLKPREKVSHYRFFDNPTTKTGRFYTVQIDILKKFANVHYDNDDIDKYPDLPASLKPNDDELMF